METIKLMNDKNIILYSKKGSSMITTIIITGFCITMMISILFACVSCVTPYILKQKIESVANKYMFVIQKYGYLTSNEEDSMLEDLARAGLNVNEIEIYCPTSKQPYGSYIKFKIIYTFTPSKLISKDDKKIVVEKSGYSNM